MTPTSRSDTLKPSTYGLALARSIAMLFMLGLCSIAAPVELDVLRWRLGGHGFAVTRHLAGGLAAPRAAIACALTSASVLGALFVAFSRQARTTIASRPRTR